MVLRSMVKRMARWAARLLAALAMTALVACGGQPAASQTAGPGGGTSGPGPTSGGGGGIPALDDPCALVTVDEVGGVLSSDPLTATGTPGDPAKCVYTNSAGDEWLTIDIAREGAANQFQTFVDAGTGESVTGVGEAAWFETSSQRLLVRSGTFLVYAHSRYAPGGPEGLATMSTIGKIAHARLSGTAIPPEAQVTAPPVISTEAACDLLSAEDAAGIIGKGPMTAQANEFAKQFCTYTVTSSGEVVLSTYLDPKGGQAGWDGFAASLTTEPVTGLGEKAMFEPSTGILFVLQGDSILNANVFGLEPEAALAQDRKLLEIMLANL